MKNNGGTIWIYLIGTILLFGLLVIIARQVILPVFNRNTDRFLYISPPTTSMFEEGKDYFATIKTTLGDIRVDLYEDSAKKNVNNFSYLADQNFYNQTYFHRVVKNTLIQGGDRNTLNSNREDDGNGKAPYLIEDEINWDSLQLSNEKRSELTSLGFESNSDISSTPLIKKYSLVMANIGPNSNSSQFFIVMADDNSEVTNWMQGRFTPIGEVVSGRNIVDQINNSEITNTPNNIPQPSTDIRVQDIIVEKI